MNRAAFALKLLELNWEDWDLKKSDKFFFIFDKKKKIQLGHGTTITNAVLLARKRILENL